MSLLFIVFWTVIIFTSIFWYGFLVFYIGAKGGKEIRQLTEDLQNRPIEKERNQTSK